MFKYQENFIKNICFNCKLGQYCIVVFCVFKKILKLSVTKFTYKKNLEKTKQKKIMQLI